MIDKGHKGKHFPPHTVEVEKGQLRFFAKAIGETDPIYTEEAAARQAGYRSLPVPPSYLFTLELAQPDPYEWINALSIDIKRMLHGEQTFDYYEPVCAGDLLTFESHIADVYDKKNGALDFVLRKTKVTNQDLQHVADLTTLLAVRNT